MDQKKHNKALLFLHLQTTVGLQIAHVCLKIILHFIATYLLVIISSTIKKDIDVDKDTSTMEIQLYICNM